MASSSNISDDEVEVDEAMSWYWWLRGVIAVVTVLGNMLVILLILTRSSLRTTHNWFVLSLAVADFLVGIVVFPSQFVFEVLLHNRPHSNYFINLTCDFLLNASTTNLCALTLDRYLYIIHPLKHIYMKKKSNLIKTLVFAWLVACVFPVVFLFLKLFVTNSKIISYYATFLIFSLYIFPCSYLAIAYFRILYFARRQQAQIKKQANQLQHNYPINRETERCKKNNRMTRVLGGVIGFFLTSYLVFTYRTWLKYVSTPPTVNDTFDKISFSLVYANSAINVFFYGLFKNDFAPRSLNCAADASDSLGIKVLFHDLVLKPECNVILI